MGMGAFVIDSNPISNKPVKKMSLDSFMKEAGGRDLNAIFQNVKTGSYSACHVAFCEATGIWIPELVPVFQKMDAIAVMGEEITPK